MEAAAPVRGLRFPGDTIHPPPSRDDRGKKERGDGAIARAAGHKASPAALWTGRKRHPGVSMPTTALERKPSYTL